MAALSDSAHAATDDGYSQSADAWRRASSRSADGGALGEAIRAKLRPEPVREPLIPPSKGLTFAPVFIDQTQPFPSGVEVYANMDALEPINKGVVHDDLCAILQGIITGVGDLWTVSDLQETRRLPTFRRLRPT